MAGKAYFKHYSFQHLLNVQDQDGFCGVVYRDHMRKESTTARHATITSVSHSLPIKLYWRLLPTMFGVAENNSDILSGIFACLHGKVPSTLHGWTGRFWMEALSPLNVTL